MAVDLILPKFNMDMESGVLVKWLRAEGDHVREGDPVAEIETDKVNMEVEATADGILTGLRFAEGDTVPVTASIATIAAEGAAGSQNAGAVRPETSASAGAATGVSAPPAAAVSDSAPASGSAGEEVGASTPISALAGGEHGSGVVAASAVPTAEPGKVRATPAVRRLARERGIDISRLAAPGERVTAAMIEAPERAGGTTVAASAPAVPPNGAAPIPVAAPGPRSTMAPEPSRGRPLDATRRAIAERMMVANEAPQITLTVEVRAGALSRLRASSAARPSFSALFAVAVARALRDHPALNVTFEDGAIVDHDGVHLGIAVARPVGLIVPVLHDADRLTAVEADRRIRDLVGKARDGGLRLDDVSGGTFTITSLGEAGIDVFSPLLNPPQVGILGIGRLANRVIAVDDGMRVEPTVHLSLSCDHRVIDGEPGAAFLGTLRGLLESPGWLASGLTAPAEEG